MFFQKYKFKMIIIIFSYFFLFLKGSEKKLNYISNKNRLNKNQVNFNESKKDSYKSDFVCIPRCYIYKWNVKSKVELRKDLFCVEEFKKRNAKITERSDALKIFVELSQKFLINTVHLKSGYSDQVSVSSFDNQCVERDLFLVRPDHSNICQSDFNTKILFGVSQNTHCFFKDCKKDLDEYWENLKKSKVIPRSRDLTNCQNMENFINITFHNKTKEIFSNLIHPSSSYVVNVIIMINFKKFGYSGNPVVYITKASVLKIYNNNKTINNQKCLVASKIVFIEI